MVQSLDRTRQANDLEHAKEQGIGLSSVDFSTGVGPRILEQLESEHIIWLTTMAPSGTPQPNVVWFHWDGEAVTVLVEPSSRRIVNLANNDRVSLHFDSKDNGRHMSVITGSATIDMDGADTPAAKAIAEKYAERIASIGTTPEAFLKPYSVAIRIVPERLRGF